MSSTLSIDPVMIADVLASQTLEPTVAESKGNPYVGLPGCVRCYRCRKFLMQGDPYVPRKLMLGGRPVHVQYDVRCAKKKGLKLPLLSVIPAREIR